MRVPGRQCRQRERKHSKRAAQQSSARLKDDVVQAMIRRCIRNILPLRADPVEHAVEAWVLVNPVPFASIGSSKVANNMLICDMR